MILAVIGGWMGLEWWFGGYSDSDLLTGGFWMEEWKNKRSIAWFTYEGNKWAVWKRKSNFSPVSDHPSPSGSAQPTEKRRFWMQLQFGWIVEIFFMLSRSSPSIWRMYFECLTAFPLPSISTQLLLAWSLCFEFGSLEREIEERYSHADGLCFKSYSLRGCKKKRNTLE